MVQKEERGSPCSSWLMKMNSGRRVKGAARLTTTRLKTEANKSQFMVFVVSFASRTKQNFRVGKMLTGPLGLRSHHSINYCN